MRDILFRGKQSDNGKWAEGSLAFFFDNPKNSMIMPRCFFGTRDFGEEDEKGNLILEDEVALGGFLDVISETVGQFTGLLDKNGKKIFEGDILTSTFGSGDPHSINFGSYYCDGENMIGWYFYPGHTSFGLTIEGNTDAYTVIGNIHDNPELL